MQKTPWENNDTGMGSYCLRVLLNRVGMTATEGGSYGVDFAVVVVIFDCGLEVRE